MAYARRGGPGDEGSVDSATSQFFFNVTDNLNLDTFNEGFTVFGEVISGLEIVDTINGFQAIDFDPDNLFDPFGELPVQDSYDGVTVFLNDLVILNGVIVLVPGDVNRDGLVNFSDISSFISILSVSGFQEEADVNRDSTVDFRRHQPVYFFAQFAIISVSNHTNRTWPPPFKIRCFTREPPWLFVGSASAMGRSKIGCTTRGIHASFW